MESSRDKSPANVLHDCVFCDAKFRTKQRANYHLLTHINESPYFCKLCPKEDRKPYNAKLHMRKHLPQSERRFHICKLCFRGFNRKQDLTYHMVTHLEERPFKCSFCPKAFKLQNCLSIHLKLHASKPVQCDKCKKFYKCAKSLYDHDYRIHRKGKQIECGICHRIFESRHLAAHMLCHTGEKPHKCQNCAKTYRHPAELRRHMDRVHLQDNFPDALHRKVNGPRVRPGRILKTDDSEKLHKCHLCDKKFRTHSQMQKHLLCHTDEKPYHCRVCEKSFKTSGDCLNHEKIHDESSKIYECHQCPKRFRRNAHLKDHINRHNKTFPKLYSCVFCNHSFDSTSVLRGHILSHTKEKYYMCFTCGFECSQVHVLRKHKISNHV